MSIMRISPEMLANVDKTRDLFLVFNADRDLVELRQPLWPIETFETVYKLPEPKGFVGQANPELVRFRDLGRITEDGLVDPQSEDSSD